MNAVELKKAIYAFLKTKCKRVYNEIAPPNTAYPFVTYSLGSSYTNDDQRQEVFFLAVDLWDNKPLDTTALETLASLVDGDGNMTTATGLHRRHYYSSGVLQFDTYRTARLELDDPDTNIHRRQLTYQVITYLE